MGGGIFEFLSLDPIGVHVLPAPVPVCLLFHQPCSPLQHPEITGVKGEAIGKFDAFSALDLPLGRWVEWADGGGRKEGIVSASWQQW